MGVATLAVSSTNTYSSYLTTLFAPLLSGALGFIENTVWFALLVLFVEFKDFFSFMIGWIPASFPPSAIIVSPIILFFETVGPFFLVPTIFGAFHVIAYLFDWGKMVWAMMMMGMMIASYYLNGKDTTPANLFHFCWNNIITAKDTLAIIG